MNAIAADVKDRIVERVATLLAMGVRQTQIATAMGLSEGRISQLASSEEVQAKRAEIEQERLERDDELNQGWDAVENESVATVLQYVRQANDPEFALKAASVANKAARRHQSSLGGPINGHPNAHAVINLSAVFIDRLQNMRIGPVEIDKEMHRIDALPVTQVERLLAPVAPQPRQEHDAARSDLAESLSAAFGVDIDVS